MFNINHSFSNLFPKRYSISNPLLYLAEIYTGFMLFKIAIERSREHVTYNL